MINKPEFKKDLFELKNITNHLKIYDYIEDSYINNETCDSVILERNFLDVNLIIQPSLFVI